LGTPLAFPDHVGVNCVYFRSPGDGRDSRVEQFHLNADRLEEGP